MRFQRLSVDCTESFNFTLFCVACDAFGDRVVHRIFTSIAQSDRVIDLSIFFCEFQAALTFAILPGKNSVSFFLCPLVS